MDKTITPGKYLELQIKCVELTKDIHPPEYWMSSAKSYVDGLISKNNITVAGPVKRVEAMSEKEFNGIWNESLKTSAQVSFIKNELMERGLVK